MMPLWAAVSGASVWCAAVNGSCGGPNGRVLLNIGWIRYFWSGCKTSSIYETHQEAMRRGNE